MITTDNYFTEIEKIRVSSLPETLRKSHEFVVKSTSNGNTWDTYHNNETIRKVINLYFEKLNQYLKGSEPSAKPHQQAESKTKKQKSIKVKKTAEKIKVKLAKQKPKSQRRPSKKVEHIREEVKFIKRFVGLHNKVKSPNSILALIKSLQKAIVQKLIRKASPLAKEIQAIQDKLVNLYNSMKGDLKIEINDKELSKLVAIAGGEEVYPSINIIKRYIGMQGKEAEHNKIDSFIKQIDSSLNKRKVTEDDPYLDKVRTILNTLKKVKSGDTISMAKAELNGLEGIVKSCGC
ncbi:MAG: hypothetical protein ABUL44_02505, partial [Flavobacterium sp.]